MNIILFLFKHKNEITLCICSASPSLCSNLSPCPPPSLPLSLLHPSTHNILSLHLSLLQLTHWLLITYIIPSFYFMLTDSSTHHLASRKVRSIVANCATHTAVMCNKVPWFSGSKRLHVFSFENPSHYRIVSMHQTSCDDSDAVLGTILHCSNALHQRSAASLFSSGRALPDLHVGLHGSMQHVSHPTLWYVRRHLFHGDLPFSAENSCPSVFKEKCTKRV